MVVSQTAKNSDSIRIYIDNEELKRTKIKKYLRVWIDEGLNWKAHIAKLRSTLSKTVGVLFKIRNYVSMYCLEILHYSLIQPKLINGMLTWEETTKENLSHLSTIQNKNLRSIIFSSRRSNLTKLYKKCEILQLDKLYKLEGAKFVFRFHNNALPSQFASMYNNINKIHFYNTRSSKDQNLYLPRRKSSLAIKRSIKFVGVKIWNKISPNISTLKTIKAFTKQLINHFSAAKDS